MKTRTLSDIEKMTPYQVWEVYVGDQPATEFMAHSPDSDEFDAAWAYVCGSGIHGGLCQDLGEEDGEVAAIAIADKMASQIRRDR